jgi:ferric-dicitrate binding protein FerR (iron transport regulator)
MKCQRYTTAVEKYIDGTIGDDLLAELESHAETCESCREELGRCALMQDVIKEALSSCTSAEKAGQTLAARIPAESARTAGLSGGEPVFSFGRQAAVAASIVLAIGLFLGFALGRAGTGRRIEPPIAPGVPLAAEVPIQVAKLEGTVLVKHEGSDLWHGLTSESKVRLGDTFHSTAKSTCVLELDPNSTLELDQNSMLVLESYDYSRKSEFNLEYGELTADLASPHGLFYISTPHGRLEALGTEFTVKVTDE